MRKVRSDSQGDGHLAASRGSRLHLGVDFEFDPGEEVLSPIDGKVYRIGYPYAGDTKYKLIEIVDRFRESIWRFFYVEPIVHVGGEVEVGEVIGMAQDVSAKYSASMKNHVHVEVNVDPRLLTMKL